MICACVVRSACLNTFGRKVTFKKTNSTFTADEKNAQTFMQEVRHAIFSNGMCVDDTESVCE